MSMRIEISDRRSGKTTNIALQMQFDRDFNNGTYFMLIFRDKRNADMFKKRYSKIIERLTQDGCPVEFIFNRPRLEGELWVIEQLGDRFDSSRAFTYIDDADTIKWLQSYYLSQLRCEEGSGHHVFMELLENLHVSATTSCNFIRNLVDALEEREGDILYLSTVLKDPRRIL